MNSLKFYIDGKWINPIKTDRLDVINPANEAIVGQITLGSSEDVDLAVIAARNAFKKFSKTSRAERLELLSEIRNIYKKDLMMLQTQF